MLCFSLRGVVVTLPPAHCRSKVENTNNERLLAGLAAVEALARGSKVQRWVQHPFRYAAAILHRRLCYPLFRRSWLQRASLFWGGTMQVALPAATDIFLTGGKTHPSETRLARFMIRDLSVNSVFFDVGAHYGYFSLLAAELAFRGQVHAFEPSTHTFGILQRNVAAQQRIRAHHVAVSRTDGEIPFYEFDNLHSEYNSADAHQFSGEAWFKKHARKTSIRSLSLDRFVDGGALLPTHVKIDVEGLEPEVIGGAQRLLSGQSKPVFMLEYLARQRGNEPHREAHHLLLEMGYRSFRIGDDGALLPTEDVDAYLEQSGLDSDNVVYRA
ncbi:MAG: FkbM family methyltransferase [Chitinophagaceae bacterium]|nr:MAG: FkbM family methyltransferase [Chitinophagaceae bacterium]